MALPSLLTLGATPGTEDFLNFLFQSRAQTGGRRIAPKKKKVTAGNIPEVRAQTPELESTLPSILMPEVTAPSPPPIAIDAPAMPGLPVNLPSALMPEVNLPQAPAIPPALIPQLPPAPNLGINLPGIQGPQINLPTPSFPQINLPTLLGPQIGLGDYGGVIGAAAPALGLNNGQLTFNPNTEQQLNIAGALADVISKAPIQPVQAIGNLLGNVAGGAQNALGAVAPIMPGLQFANMEKEIIEKQIVPTAKFIENVTTKMFNPEGQTFEEQWNNASTTEKEKLMTEYWKANLKTLNEYQPQGFAAKNPSMAELEKKSIQANIDKVWELAKRYGFTNTPGGFKAPPDSPIFKPADFKNPFAGVSVFGRRLG